MTPIIYITRNGQQEGPYTVPQINQFLADGTIAPYTLAWKDGLSDWVPLSILMDQLPSIPVSPISHSNTTVPAAPSQTKNPGIGRLTYFGIMIGVMIVSALVQVAIGPKSSAANDVTLLAVAASFIPLVYRLRNIGISGWWSLVSLIPIANLFIGVLALLAPPGYERSKKLDTPAKVILWTLIGSILLLVALAVVASIS